MAQALMTYETIDAQQIDDLMAGKEPQPPKDWTGPVLPKIDDDGNPMPQPDLNNPAAEV